MKTRNGARLETKKHLAAAPNPVYIGLVVTWAMTVYVAGTAAVAVKLTAHGPNYDPKRVWKTSA